MVLVDQLAGVFFHMDTHQSDEFFCAVGEFDFHSATKAIRLIVLGDLVALRQIRIKIMFTVEFTVLLHISAQRQGGLYGQHDRRFIDDRQGARKT